MSRPEARAALSRFTGRSAAAASGVAERHARLLDRVPQRVRRWLRNPIVQTALAAAAIAWLTWPVDNITPEPGVDPSWQAALYMGSRQSLDFGEDLIFSYGPLGYLVQPYLYYAPTAGLAGLYVAALQFATAGSLLWVGRSAFGFLGAAVIAFAIAKLAILVFPTTLLVPPLVFLWCAYAIRRRSDRWFLAVAMGGGFIAALELLIRLNVGVVVFGLCAVTLLMEGGRRLRNLGVLVGSAVGSFLLLWLAAGQGLGAIPDYLLYSFEIVAGYTDAMAFEDITREWEYSVAAAVAAVVLYVGWRNTEGWRRNDRLKLLALGVVLGFPTFKQGFVRHDYFHSGVWFLSAAVVLVALAWRRDRRAEAVLGLTCALVALSAARLEPSQLNPITSAHKAVDQLGTVLSSRRFTAAAGARQALRNVYGLDEQTLGRIRGRTVHIYGNETSLAWAYPEVRWHPLPAFQSYVTYTRRLDELNAKALARDGPEFVLRGQDTTLDGRHFTLEAPETMLTMFCRYREVSKVGTWELLQREPDRCGTPRKLGSISTRVGEHFEIPSGSGRGLVVMQVRELEKPLGDSLRSLAWHPRALFATVNNSAIFRVIPATLRAKTIVRIPDELDYRGYPLSVDAKTIAFFDNWGGGPPGPAMTVDFYEVPIEAR